jgi:hypothetical protein
MRIVKIFFCKLLILVLISNSCVAQQENYVPPQGLNNWFIEAGGPALFYSVNYEKYLYRSYSEQTTWTARVGMGFTPFNFDILNTVFVEKNTFMVPFSSSLLLGKGHEKLEVGAGFSMLTKDFSQREIIPHANIGLRVMESNKICFRLSYVPFYRNNSITHWIGVSLGKNFSFK